MKRVMVADPIVMGEVRFTFQEFLTGALDQYEPLGKGAKQIRQSAKIHDAIDAIKDFKEVRFEDADFEVVKAAVESAKWNPKLSYKLVSYFDAIEKAEEVKP